jgi:uncharacterized cupredoxin-like copper-binding protein
MRHVLAIASTVVLITGCSPKVETEVPEAPPAPQQVTITATEFNFAAPDTIAPGMTVFTLVNSGAQEHHAILAHIGDGKTMADVEAEMAKQSGETPEWLTFYGAASGIGPGNSTGAAVDLPAGNYVLVCFINDPADGAPHMMKGMVRPITVAGEAVAATPPTADGEIQLKDFAFELPAMTAGVRTFRITNAGPALHEVQLVKLVPGATEETYGASLAPGYTGPPQGTALGGGGAISPGIEQWWTANLEAGNYLVTCFVPDASGTPHLMLGMVQSFTVAPAS